MLPTITTDRIDLPPGTLLQFPGTITDYEAILKRFGDRNLLTSFYLCNIKTINF